LAFVDSLAPLLQKNERSAAEEFKCICADGWTGIVCDQPIETCPHNANPCKNGKKSTVNVYEEFTSLYRHWKIEIGSQAYIVSLD
jgi:hypothetical protein